MPPEAKPCFDPGTHGQTRQFLNSCSVLRLPRPSATFRLPLVARSRVRRKRVLTKPCLFVDWCVQKWWISMDTPIYCNLTVEDVLVWKMESGWSWDVPYFSSHWLIMIFVIRKNSEIHGIMVLRSPEMYWNVMSAFSLSLILSALNAARQLFAAFATLSLPFSFAWSVLSGEAFYGSLLTCQFLLANWPGNHVKLMNTSFKVPCWLVVGIWHIGLIIKSD